MTEADLRHMGPPGVLVTATVRSPRAALGLLALLVVVWGANWPLMKVAIDDCPPLTFTALRLYAASAAVFALLALRRRVALPPRHDLPVVFSVGLLQMAGFMGLAAIALQVVPAGRSAVLAYTTPLWVLPGAAIFLGETLTRRHLAGFLTGMAGVALLFNPASLPWDDTQALWGNGLLMLAALLWASQILHVRHHRWQADALALAPWQSLVAALALTPVALLLEAPLVPGAVTWSATLLAVLLYNAIPASAFAFWAVVTVNRALPAATTSLVLLAVPAAGILASLAMLGEVPGLEVLGGLALITAGVAFQRLAAPAGRR